MYIGIDIGGTNTRVATNISLDNPSLGSKDEFKTSQNFDETISNIIDSIKQTGSEIKAIGLSVPGTLNANKTAIVSAINLPGWGSEKPIVETLAKEFDCPVYMDNDSIVGGLGEAYYGLEEKLDFLYMIWGTGIGCSSINWINNKVQVNKADWSKYLSKWEMQFGGNKLKQRFGKPAESLNESEWEQILAKFREAVLDLSAQLNYKTVILGGGIAVKQQVRINKIFEDIEHPRVLVSKLGEDTSLYGTFALIKTLFTRVKD